MKGAQLSSPSAGQHDVRSLLMGLHDLRKSQVDAAYWASFCELVAALCRARAGMAVQRAGEGWTVLGRGGSDPAWLGEAWIGLVEDVAPRAAANGFAYAPTADNRGEPRLFAAVRIMGAADALVLLDIAQQERGMLNELLMRAMLVADVGGRGAPEAPGMALAATSAEALGVAHRGTDGDLLAMLDLVAQVMQTRSFELASLKLANGLAAHFALVQCVVGWNRGGSMYATAVSHLEKFERKSENIRRIEEALEETASEEMPLAHPPAEGAQPGGPAHMALCESLGYAQVCTLPLRDKQGNVESVLLLAFPAVVGRLPESGALLLALEMLQPWLADLHQRDRWWGRRLAGWAQGHLERFVGPGHPWAKAAAAIASIALLYLVFGTWNYRVEATAQITTDSTRMVSAQFDGRVEEVHATAGDPVRAGAVLAVLDTRDMRQQEIEAQAERSRYEAEAARHRAEDNLADMEVALARLAQADARLVRLRDYIAHARNVAPFDGVVVEGERKDLQGMPVKKGDHLFRVAQVQGLYALLHVPERDIRDIQPGAGGELSLLSRPDQKIAFELSAVIPVAQVKGRRQPLHADGRMLTPPEPWWRPGMTGMARIDVGERNVGWVLTHRLVDAVRMKFWW
ncbi:HlyD family efflux transporter periplasmic adaptor subunit [Ramlibacter terrae]|uniref:HlyD family efflux transporter periplasmic adaptor subunit n=1 Tax=Ramlibacter terrae TaxID=2732511 RepID=A0ABX6P3H0_9BURK|nr:HlyD family efflux transporter periplasmic adaptor subunit [Ramlibacter terrae]